MFRSRRPFCILMAGGQPPQSFKLSRRSNVGALGALVATGAASCRGLHLGVHGLRKPSSYERPRTARNGSGLNWRAGIAPQAHATAWALMLRAGAPCYQGTKRSYIGATAQLKNSVVVVLQPIKMQKWPGASGTFSRSQDEEKFAGALKP